jgi:hypothetical protein
VQKQSLLSSILMVIRNWAEKNLLRGMFDRIIYRYFNIFLFCILDVKVTKSSQSFSLLHFKQLMESINYWKINTFYFIFLLNKIASISKVNFCAFFFN